MGPVRVALEAETPAELQALAVLAAAAELAAEIDLKRQELAERDPARSRTPARARLLEAAERLVNLLVLLQRRAHEYGPGFAAAMETQVDVLRRRLLGSTRSLVVDRARAVSRRATAVLDGECGYPLGLTAKLRAALAGVEMTVEVLGGRGILSDEESQALAEAGRQVTRLAERESAFDLLESVA